MLRQFVINADDLGLTVGVNDGIFDAHDLGILTSASALSNGTAIDDAIRRARARRSLGIGVHLALVDGTPTLPPHTIPTLVADDGRFRRSWRPFIVACLQNRVSMVEVERELTAQIDRIRAAGISITHLDAHKHVHAYPPIFDIVARLAVRFAVPVVRVPYERWRAWPGVSRDATAATIRRQALMNAALWPWAHRNYRAASRLGLRTPHFVGRVDTGVLARSAVRRMFQDARPGVTELMVHPGYVDDALRGMATRLLASRREEVALLCSMEMRALLVGERIQLVRHDLAPSWRRSLRHVS